MQPLARSLLTVGLVLGALAACSANAEAQDSTEDRLRALEERLQQQDAEIERLKSQLEARKEATDSVEKELDAYLSRVESTSGLTQPVTFGVFWKDGLRMETSDRVFKMRLGGNIMNDWSWLRADDDLAGIFTDELADQTLRSTEFRRARFYVAGSLYDFVEFRAEYDFAGGDADFINVWLSLNKLPVIGHLRVGHSKMPMGLETLTNCNYTTFMERADTSALLPFLKTGFIIFDTELDKRLFWALAYYAPASDSFGNGAIDNGLAARIAGTPWYAKDGNRLNLLHLGISAAMEDSGQDGQFTVESGPPDHNTPIRPISVTVDADSRAILAAEMAVIFRQFSLQGEYVEQLYRGGASADARFHAWYVYASWFITGEQRPYLQKFATFDRVRPKANFLDGDGGIGALELALRFDVINADDGGYYGGEMASVTVGLNWYLNPHVRIMFNYFRSAIKETQVVENSGSPGATISEKGELSGFMMRFQIDF